MQMKSFYTTAKALSGPLLVSGFIQRQYHGPQSLGRFCSCCLSDLISCCSVSQSLGFSFTGHFGVSSQFSVMLNQGFHGCYSFCQITSCCNDQRDHALPLFSFLFKYFLRGFCSDHLVENFLLPLPQSHHSASFLVCFLKMSQL